MRNDELVFIKRNKQFIKSSKKNNNNNNNTNNYVAKFSQI